MGPTWPNRFYLHAATSGGNKGNTPIVGSPPTIWDRLKAKGISCRNYNAGIVHWMTGGFPLRHNDVKQTISNFFSQAQNGTLPQFSIIDPDYQANDDHPSHDIMRGQAFIASVYKALAESPLWSKTLLVITYDEHGGFYDHVAPPKTTDERAEFEQLGFRVPAFVIGPTVKKGYVSKKQYEHVSVLATLRTRFEIADLNARMTATNDISDCIDATKVKSPNVPPTGMPVVAMTMEAALTRAVGKSSQPELDALVESGAAPAMNPKNHAVRIGNWLEHAVRLGAIRIVGS
jgi:phospholipase C